MTRSASLGIALSAALVMVGFAVPASAQDIAREVARCGAIGEDTARLRCFDGLLPAARKTDAERQAEAAIAAREQFGLTGTQLSEQGKRNASKGAGASAIVPEENARIEAKIASVNSSTYGTVFALDNGQVWQTTSFGELNTVPRAGQGVLVKSGPLGGYRLVLEGKTRELGVKRIK